MITKTLSRIVVVIIAILALAVELAYLPSNLTRLLTNWQALASYSVVKSGIPYESYSLLLMALSYLVTLLFWIAAGLVFYETTRRTAGDGDLPYDRQTKPEILRIGLITTLLLVLAPLLLTLGLSGTDPGLAEPWNALVAAAGSLLSMAGLLILVSYYHIFPTGRFVSARLGWVTLGIMTGLGLLILLLSLGFLDETWAWPVSMLAIIAVLLFGVGVLIYRYKKILSGNLKRQVIWPVSALALQPLFWLAFLVTGSSGWGDLIRLWLQILLPALIPSALLWAMYRRGLWRGSVRKQPKRAGQALALSLAAIWLVGAGWFWLEAARPAGQKQTFEPLSFAETPRPVVIDTDMAPDDWMAILFLLQRPEITVKAITVSGTGETHCEAGVRNALRLVKLAGASGIPVACGRETPLEGAHAFPDSLRQRADTLNGMVLPEGETPVPGLSAVDLLTTTLQGSPEKVTLLALGPLTNLAELAQRYPGWQEKVEQIYAMGGALQVEGNVGFFGIDNQLAEWNFYIDPTAVRIVLESGAPLTLIPLDATDDVPIDLDFYRNLQANQVTREAKFVYQLLASQLDFITSGGYYFWDPLAAAVLVDESLAEIKEGELVVSLEEGQRSGVTRLQADGAPIRYTSSADARRFWQEFLRTLNQP